MCDDISAISASISMKTTPIFSRRITNRLKRPGMAVLDAFMGSKVTRNPGPSVERPTRGARNPSPSRSRPGASRARLAA
ncbi:hypothetical protein GCM10009830_24190 [Glycomyces endophyticus]|uniref:Uncharacterized protein n=1 Tax=Glycomyces endophyticus TaxID=480996 RepID=A0ABN2GTM6_9ACTN